MLGIYKWQNRFTLLPSCGLYPKGNRETMKKPNEQTVKHSVWDIYKTYGRERSGEEGQEVFVQVEWSGNTSV